MNQVAGLFLQEFPIAIGIAIFMLALKFRFNTRKIRIEVDEPDQEAQDSAKSSISAEPDKALPVHSNTLNLPSSFRELFPEANCNASFMPLLDKKYERHSFWHGFIGTKANMKRDVMALHMYERLITNGMLRKASLQGINMRKVHDLGFSLMGMLPIYNIHGVRRMAVKSKPEMLNVVMSKEDWGRLLLSLLRFSPISGILLSYLSSQKLGVQVI